MFCRYCGKEIADGAGFCPYCGKNMGEPQGEEPGGNAGNEDSAQNAAQDNTMQGSVAEGRTKSSRTVTISVKWIVAIIVIVAAVIVLVGVLVFMHSRNGSTAATGQEEVVVLVQPQLSAANVQVAEDVIGIANDYLNGNIQYASSAVSQVLIVIDNVSIPAETDDSYGITMEALVYMYKIEAELVGFEWVGTAFDVVNGADSYGGDEDKLQQYCSELADLAGISY